MQDEIEMYKQQVIQHTLRPSGQKVRKDIKDPNNIINKGGWDTSQTFYTDNQEYIFISNPGRTLTKLTIDQLTKKCNKFPEVGIP